MVQAAAFTLLIVSTLLLALHQPVTAGLLALQFSGMVLLGLAAMREFLRQREYHADMWAADQLGDPAPVEEALGSALDHGPQRNRGTLFDSHPRRSERVRALHERRWALTFTPTGTVLAATAVGLFVAMLDLFLPLAGIRWLTEHADSVAGAIGGILLGRVLTIGLWRNNQIDRLTGHRRQTGLLTALIATTGLYLGSLLPLQLTFQPAFAPMLPIDPRVAVAAALALIAFCLWTVVRASIRLGPPSRADRSAYRRAARSGSIVLAGLLALVYHIAGLVRHDTLANAAPLPGMPDVRHIVDRPTPNHLIDLLLRGLIHNWLAYAVAGVALLGLLTALAGRRRTPPVSLAPPEPFRSTTAWRPPAEAAQSGEAPAAADPSATPIPRRRGAAAVALSVASLTVMLIAVGLQWNLPYLVTAATAALALAWYADLGCTAPKWLIVASYTACVIAGLVTTLPPHRYHTLLLIAVGLAGTALVVRSNVIKNDDDRHVLILITSCLFLYPRPWLLAVWIPAAIVLAVILARALDSRNTRMIAPTSLAMAISSFLVIATAALVT